MWSRKDVDVTTLNLAKMVRVLELSGNCPGSYDPDEVKYYQQEVEYLHQTLSEEEYKQLHAAYRRVTEKVGRNLAKLAMADYIPYFRDRLDMVDLFRRGIVGGDGIIEIVRITKEVDWPEDHELFTLAVNPQRWAMGTIMELEGYVADNGPMSKLITITK